MLHSALCRCRHGGGALGRTALEQAIVDRQRVAAREARRGVASGSPRCRHSASAPSRVLPTSTRRIYRASNAALPRPARMRWSPSRQPWGIAPRSSSFPPTVRGSAITCNSGMRRGAAPAPSIPAGCPASRSRSTGPSGASSTSCSRTARRVTVVAGESHSLLTTVEHQLRWAGQKADSLPSAQGWPWADTLEPPRIGRLLLLRSSRPMHDLVRAAPQTFRAAYPADPTRRTRPSRPGDGRWPGAAILWVTIDGTHSRLIAGRPRGLGQL